MLAALAVKQDAHYLVVEIQLHNALKHAAGIRLEYEYPAHAVLLFALFRSCRQVLHIHRILTQCRDIVLIDKVYLVILAACIKLLEIVCYLKRLVNYRRVAQLGKGLYYIEPAVCQHILAPSAADDKTVVLARLLYDGVCIVQDSAVVRSAEAAVAHEQDIADLFYLFMRRDEAVFQTCRAR